MKKVTIILLGFYIISVWSCGFNCDNYLNAEIKPLLIEGIVVGKSGKNCFGEIILKHKNRIDTLKDICYCTPKNQQLWKYIKLNDTLYKEAGSLKVVVIRNSESEAFDYPCCDQ